MKNFMLILVFIGFYLPVSGQMKSEEAMAKLGFLLGNWEGQANVVIGPGQRVTVDQFEQVESRLGGQMMIIEGKGYEQGQLEFNAFAVITFNESNQKYEMKSWLKTGEYVDAYMQQNEDNLWEWGFDFPQGKLRYFISLNDSGQWIERGEYSPNGSVWYPNFDMVLSKK